MPVIHQSAVTKVEIASDRIRYLANTEHLMIVVLDFNNGPWALPDPPHAHPHEQVTYVAEGEVRFFLDGEPADVKSGDLITIPGGIPHFIQVLTPHARMVDIFTPIREDFLT